MEELIKHYKDVQDTAKEIAAEQYRIYVEHYRWLDEYSDWLENHAITIVDNDWIYDIRDIVQELIGVLDEQQTISSRVWNFQINELGALIDEQTGNE